MQLRNRRVEHERKYAWVKKRGWVAGAGVWIRKLAEGGEIVEREEVKNLADFQRAYIFALLSRKPVIRSNMNAALVNRLRRLPFTEE
jgi:hypothetical protein